MPHARLGLLTLSALCLSILAVGLIAEHFDWLSDLEVVVQRSPARFPSSQVVSPGELARARSVLSVYTEARYLDDPGIGLFTNPTRVGRDWEHPATVSYFEEGALRFASNIGLRLHGGTSRIGSPVQSFRLYFRRDYGSAQFRPGTLFDGKGDPLERLVAHNDLGSIGTATGGISSIRWLSISPGRSALGSRDPAGRIRAQRRASRALCADRARTRSVSGVAVRPRQFRASRVSASTVFG